jgi:hypothetical protein
VLASLYAAGKVVIRDGMASLLPGKGDDAPGLPASRHGMGLQRLDRPEPEEQLSLRVAAVAGMNFPTKRVTDIHPLQMARSELHRHLQALSKLAVLEPMAAGDDPPAAGSGSDAIVTQCLW